MNKTLTVVAICFSTIVLAQDWQPNKQQEKVAERVFQRYLALIDDGKYREAYKLQGKDMKELMPFAQWLDLELEFKNFSGGNPARTPRKAIWIKDPKIADAPGGLVSFGYDCRYEYIDICYGAVFLFTPDGEHFYVARHERIYIDKETEREVRSHVHGKPVELIESGVDEPVSEMEKHVIVQMRYQQPWLANFFERVEQMDHLEIFSKDYYPEDFLREYDQHKSNKVRPMVIWTGIVAAKSVKEETDDSAPSEEIVVDHTYWDWNTTIDEHLIFISNRGYGKFLCAIPHHRIDEGFEIGDFVISYGIPISIISGSGLINFECMRSMTVDPSLFTVRAWGYGRDFVDEGDLSDLRILRADIE